MDVTDDESLQSGVKHILAEQGRIDVLVNAAGYGSYGALEDVPLAEARDQFEVNVFGAARLTQLVLPHMRAQRSGTIINITSMGGKIYTPLGGWYHATKFALEALSDCLRLEVKPFGINVVVMEKVAMQTKIAAASPPASWEESLQRRPLRQPGRRRGRLADLRRHRPAVLPAHAHRRHHRQGRHRTAAQDPLRRRLRRQAHHFHARRSCPTARSMPSSAGPPAVPS